MPPLVSILIPAWNSAAWIAETLDSALAQTHPRTEIIVIDDGSTDQTLSLARAHAARHPGRIHVATQPNSGASAARNHALRLATGDFIQFLDADDLLSPRKLELQLALLSSRPPATLATCRWGRFDTDPAATRFVDRDVARDFTPRDYMLAHLGGPGVMMHPAAWLIPRAVAGHAGPWAETLSLNDDGEYFARVILASSGLAYAADPAASSHYRSNLSGNLSARRSPGALVSLEKSCALVAAHVTSALGGDSALRSALADYWQRLAYELHPDAAPASRAAESRAREFGGSSLPPPIGPRFRILSRLLGWRLARRLRRYC